MVRVLIRLRQTVQRHQAERGGTGWLLLAAALALVSAVGTVLVGTAGWSDRSAVTDAVSLVLALWMFGRIAESALARGTAGLPAELFGLLGLPRGRLARALLVVDLADPATAFVTIACGSLVALGVRSGAATAVVGVAGAALTAALVSALSTVAGGLLGPGSRRGRDAGTVLLAVGLSTLAVAGSLLPALLHTLRNASSPTLSDAVRILPSGWGAVAVDAARRSDWGLSSAALAGLVVLLGLVAGVWPAVLGRRMEGAAAPRRSGAARGSRYVLPRSPSGAVAGKELRLWARDPIRLTCLLIAVLVGFGVCAIPRVTSGTGVLLPFAGLLTALIAGACACNLYGSDGGSIWLTVLTPGGTRPDILGRQTAWLVLVAPFTVVESLVMTAVSGVGWAWPWVLGGLPALLGGAAGCAAYGSLVSVQPLDDTGSPTPAWSLKVHVALVVEALTALPPVVLLIGGTAAGIDPLRWLAVPVGMATGVAWTFFLGRRAIRRLETHQLDLLILLAGKRDLSHSTQAPGPGRLAA